MNYPIWVVPFLGGGWVIGIIAIIHVMLSHFAVGGGAFLALTEQLAYKRNDESVYDYLKKHSLFFMLITTVSGALTGVAIWWAISLVSPDGTATLIQNFTLGWAVEYLFFVGELATIFVYYYTWDKISREAHLLLARIYFVLSVMTLVVINGILTFMLTPAGWIKTGYWLVGFFNETYLPSLFMRLLIMFALAGMYAMVTASQVKNEETRTYLIRFCAKWLLPIFLLGPIVGFWYLKNVPQAAIDTIFTGIQSSGIGNFSILARVLYLAMILSGTIVIFAYVGPYLNPKGLTTRIALMFMICGLAVTGSTEYMRELLRKPYVVYDYMYTNGIRKTEVEKLNQAGFLASSKWAGLGLDKNCSEAERGQRLFQFQCMGCHTENGYRGMKKLIGDRDKDAILGLLTTLHSTEKDKNPYIGVMPPLVANDQEIKDLAAYLDTLNPNKSTAAKPKSIASN